MGKEEGARESVVSANVSISGSAYQVYKNLPHGYKKIIVSGLLEMYQELCDDVGEELALLCLSKGWAKFSLEIPADIRRTLHAAGDGSTARSKDRISSTGRGGEEGSNKKHKRGTKTAA